MMLEIYARWGTADPRFESLPAGEAVRLGLMRRTRNAVLVGILSLDLGRVNEAEEAFTEGLRLAPTAKDRAVCLYNLAAVAEAKGDRAAALAYAQRCLQEAPNSASAQMLVARLR